MPNLDLPVFPITPKVDELCYTVGCMVTGKLLGLAKNAAVKLAFYEWAYGMLAEGDVDSQGGLSPSSSVGPVCPVCPVQAPCKTYVLVCGLCESTRGQMVRPFVSLAILAPLDNLEGQSPAAGKPSARSRTSHGLTKLVAPSRT